MPLPLPKDQPETCYTYADYLSWDEDERIEIMNGKAVMMAPPTRKHQKISGAIFAQLYYFLKDKNCEVYPAPFGVRLFERDGDNPNNVTTVVEPDITVVCDKNKLDDRGCKGAPDMIVEILSPSTASYDMLQKLGKYQQAGVKEYWIVDPESETVIVYLLVDGAYKSLHVYYPPEIAPVTVLEGCTIDLAEVFAE